MHPRAGHGVTHFKKNRRAKKASIFFPPPFSLSLSFFRVDGEGEGKKKRRVAKRRGEERRGEARLIRLSTYQVRSKWISREVSRKMFFCFPFSPLSFFPPLPSLLPLSLLVRCVTSFQRFEQEGGRRRRRSLWKDSLESF